LLRRAQHKEALADADECIKLAPTFSKGYSRRAFALYKQGLYTEAIHTCDAGLKEDAENASLLSTRASAVAGRESWSRHTASGPTHSPIPQWLSSLLAPLRAILFYFAFSSSTAPGSKEEWETFLQIAMAGFVLGIVPDLLAKNWRGCMQGHAAHYVAFSALLYFGGTGPIPFLPGTALIILINIPEFFRCDLGGMLAGSSYGAALDQFARKAVRVHLHCFWRSI
jgi:tetratricopeptide (TPR) repeat protein